MFRKLFVAYLALVLLALAIFGLLTAQSTRRRVLEEVAHRLEAQTDLLRPLVRAHPAPQEALAGLRSRETRLTVIAPGGAVIADSHANPAQMENHHDRPEVQEARARGAGRQVRYSETVLYDMMYFAVLLDPERRDGVVLRAALPLTRVRSELGALTGTILVAFAVVAVAGAGVTFLLARRFARPLARIRDVAEEIAAGDLARRAPRLEGDEVASVATALNRMSDELAARMARLRAETSKLEAVIGSMKEGVVAVDGAGKILHFNAAARALFELPADPSGLLLWEALRLPGLDQAARRVLAGGEGLRTTFEIGARSVAVGLGAVAGGQGAVLVGHDVTEERRYDALRREFVANVSHELRTPLSIMRGYVETLADGAWKDDQKAPEFLKILEDNVRRLQELVEDILDLSKLESGGQIVSPREVDLPALFEKVCASFRPVAEKRRQQLRIAATVPGLRADPDLLERALANLVDNALKYTPEGGEVTLRAEEGDRGVEITVEDNGIGIPEPDLARVFERFYRVDKSRTRGLGGTGLGLSIVKHILQLHGGEATVRSQPGRGSAFTLRFPR